MKWEDPYAEQTPSRDLRGPEGYTVSYYWRDYEEVWQYKVTSPDGRTILRVNTKFKGRGCALRRWLQRKHIERAIRCDVQHSKVYLVIP